MLKSPNISNNITQKLCNQSIRINTNYFYFFASMSFNLSIVCFFIHYLYLYFYLYFLLIGFTINQTKYNFSNEFTLFHFNSITYLCFIYKTFMLILLFGLRFTLTSFLLLLHMLIYFLFTFIILLFLLINHFNSNLSIM